MNLTDARSLIHHTLTRMNTVYRQPVFDEWVLVKLAREQGAILSYNGPRAESYQRQFKTDIAPLQAELEERHMAIGDFAFVTDATATRFDACVRLGPAAYLFCNNTTKTMAEIRQDPSWLQAQKPFVDLSSQFRTDPLE